MDGILTTDQQPDDVQIKISEYLSNMSTKVFEVGEPFERLQEEIEQRAKLVLGER